MSARPATLRADPPVGDADALRRLGGSEDLRYWVVHDLADAIHAAAAQTPLAIVLEDIHWADNGTLLARLPARQWCKPRPRCDRNRRRPEPVRRQTLSVAEAWIGLSELAAESQPRHNVGAPH
jgi:hypothetical protein